MPWLDIVWTNAAQRKLAEHGVSPDEAADVLQEPAYIRQSLSSGRPIAFGETKAGRWLAVVYERVDDITVMPVTAYEPSEV